MYISVYVHSTRGRLGVCVVSNVFVFIFQQPASPSVSELASQQFSLNYSYTDKKSFVFNCFPQLSSCLINKKKLYAATWLSGEGVGNCTLIISAYIVHSLLYLISYMSVTQSIHSLILSANCNYCIVKHIFDLNYLKWFYYCIANFNILFTCA